jgi:erythromycin esterase-like protein
MQAPGEEKKQWHVKKEHCLVRGPRNCVSEHHDNDANTFEYVDPFEALLRQRLHSILPSRIHIGFARDRRREKCDDQEWLVTRSIGYKRKMIDEGQKKAKMRDHTLAKTYPEGHNTIVGYIDLRLLVKTMYFCAVTLRTSTQAWSCRTGLGCPSSML